MVGLGEAERQHDGGEREQRGPKTLKMLHYIYVSLTQMGRNRPTKGSVPSAGAGGYHGNPQARIPIPSWLVRARAYFESEPDWR